jgi:thioredoxin reductase (NADPH)
MEILDILIIGGGPIGLNCALEAQKNNLSYRVIEKGTIVNSLYNYPLYMRFSRLPKNWKLMEFLYFNSSKTGKTGSAGILSGNCKTAEYQHQFI